jgi:hypothetical protein
VTDVQRANALVTRAAIGSRVIRKKGAQGEQK